MLKEERMWMVTCYLKVLPAEVYRDAESGKLLIGYDPNTDEFYNIVDEDNLFPTEEAAQKYKNERLKYLADMAKEIPDLINNIKDLDKDICDFDRSDIMKIQMNDYFQKQYQEVWDKYKLLKIYVKSGMINVNAVTIRKEDVSRLKWYDNDRVMIITQDGKKVMTQNEAEYSLICLLFGYNESNRVFQTSK